MIFFVAFLLTISGMLATYVAVGLTRTQERRRGYEECERRIEILKRQLIRRHR